MSQGTRIRATVRVGATVAAFALIAAACGDDDGDGDGAAGSDTATVASVEAPSGEPIVIAQANLEGSPQGSFPDARLGAEAAVAYVNEELGGVHGRPLELETCLTRGSPESSVSCANDLVARNPVAFIGGADFFAFASLPVYNSSGIPFVGGTSLAESELEAPNTYKFNASGAGNWPALIAYAVDELDAETIAVLHPDNIPGNSAVDGFLQPAARAKDAELTSVPYAPDTPDYFPTMSNVVADDPDVIVAIAPPLACPGVLNAYQSLSIDVPFFITSNCLELSVLETVGEETVEGVYTVAATAGWDDSEDAKTYRQAVKKYVDREQLDGFGEDTFAAVMNLYAILADLDPAGITAEAITAALEATNETPGFMAHPYTCEGEVVPGRPALCDAHTRVQQMQEGKREAITDWVDHSDLVPPPN